MSNGNGNSSVGIVAIIAILILFVAGMWFMFGRSGRTVSPKPPAQTTEQPTIDVKVNLPDSISIKH